MISFSQILVEMEVGVDSDKNIVIETERYAIVGDKAIPVGDKFLSVKNIKFDTDAKEIVDQYEAHVTEGRAQSMRIILSTLMEERESLRRKFTQKFRQIVSDRFSCRDVDWYNVDVVKQILQHFVRENDIKKSMMKIDEKAFLLANKYIWEEKLDEKYQSSKEEEDDELIDF